MTDRPGGYGRRAGAGRCPQTGDTARMRGGRLASVVLVAGLAAGLVAVSAGAAPPASRPPGSPDLAALALATFDLPAGTRIVRQRYYRDPAFVASYERELSLGGARVGRSSLLSILHDLSVSPDATAASRTFQALAAALGTRAFRAALAAEIAEGADVGAKDVTVGRPRRPRIGDGTISIPVQVRTQGLRLQAAIGFTAGRSRARRAHRRRVPGENASRRRRRPAGATCRRQHPQGPRTRPRRATARHGRSQSWPVAHSGHRHLVRRPNRRLVPVGALRRARARLLGDPGRDGSDVHAGRRRSRVHRPRDGDGTNQLGTAMATSATTPFVVGPSGSPVATEAPLVTGSETLTVTTGIWTGTPTSFAYQWRRCSLTTGALRRCHWRDRGDVHRLRGRLRLRAPRPRRRTERRGRGRRAVCRTGSALALFEPADHRKPERRSTCAVDDTVVERHCDRSHPPHDDLSVADDRSGCHAADAQDRHLRVIDDRRLEEPGELARARDRERRAANLVGLQLSGTRAFRELPDLLVELLDRTSRPTSLATTTTRPSSV